MKEMSEINSAEKRLSVLKKKLEARIERTDIATIEARKIREALKKINKSGT